jgi:hypothetical protein
MDVDEEQQQPLIHRSVLDAIARLTDPRYRDERHKLRVDCGGNGPWTDAVVELH